MTPCSVHTADLSPRLRIRLYRSKGQKTCRRLRNRNVIHDQLLKHSIASKQRSTIGIHLTFRLAVAVLRGTNSYKYTRRTASGVVRPVAIIDKVNSFRARVTIEDGRTALSLPLWDNRVVARRPVSGPTNQALSPRPRAKRPAEPLPPQQPMDTDA